ncbi:MAG TPA: DNA mismatch repair protein MutS [Polyangiaceae bacterium]|nr:DNA mismatch repair protein MutS [Polyangiaceae bacterium]
MLSATPEQGYGERAAQFAQQADELGRKVASIANLRGLSFAAALVLALIAAFAQGQAWAAPALVPCVALFVGSVVWHGRVIAAWETALRWWYVNEHGRLRAGGEWRSLPDRGEGLAPSNHPYANDLDLFGPSSLFQRINVAHTRFGQQLLASWLCQPTRVEDAQRRQRIARKLAPDVQLRQELEARTLSLSLPRIWTRSDVKPIAAPDPEPLLSWAESARLPQFSNVHVSLLRALTVVTLSCVVAANVWPLPKLVWFVPVCLQLVVAFRFRDVVAHAHHSVSLGQGVFAQYGPTLQLLERCLETTPELGHLRERLVGQGQPQAAMTAFARWVGWLELRSNPLVHPVANGLLLWDVHCLVALGQWQRQWGGKVRGWFHAVGELEALCALAGIAFDNPGYAWPELAEGPPHFEAQDLGHPLIEANARVGNTVSLLEPGTALLITGSNMSGKSTLLRAMGLAQVMALAGAPVCASAFRGSALTVRSSLRISDSLEQGVSHFYAELAKLKAAVETARSTHVLFLLDEILHGTNSVERQIGARWVLSELLQTGSIGAVSTHDTALCQLSGTLMQRVSQVHLRETVDSERMTFDYLLRPGPVQGGNALRLMRTLGLNVPLEGHG